MANNTWSGLTLEQDQIWEQLWNKYVPASGTAETIGGEILRAMSRIIYRFYNDGELHKVRGVPCKIRKEQSMYSPNESYEVSVYILSLKAILKACSSPRGYKLVTEVLSGEGDYFTANNLLQIALFGEEIYG